MPTAAHSTATNHSDQAAIYELPKMSGGKAYAEVRSAVDEMEKDGRQGEARDFLLAALAAVLRKAGELELRLAKIERERVGKRGERTDHEQLALLLDELSRSAAAADIDPEALAREDAELTRAIEDAESIQETPRKAARGSWRTGQKVPREVKVHTVTESEKQCGRCGREKNAMGHDEL